MAAVARVADSVLVGHIMRQVELHGQKSGQHQSHQLPAQLFGEEQAQTQEYQHELGDAEKHREQAQDRAGRCIGHREVE